MKATLEGLQGIPVPAPTASYQPVSHAVSLRLKPFSAITAPLIFKVSNRETQYMDYLKERRNQIRFWK
jgi:hypothetical protein